MTTTHRQHPASTPRGMRVITACDVIPGAGRHGLRLLARPAPGALGVPACTARTRPALRARRHPEGADPQQVARRASRSYRWACAPWTVLFAMGPVIRWPRGDNPDPEGDDACDRAEFGTV